ncbi:hypothetical protein P3T73_12430 [Kiritimatiellota bacterium B12222]|nr:hypothetical protein P3T73_12430 [Kiritimatiellota bacterium B12222]
MNRRFASILQTSEGVAVVEGWPDNPTTSILKIAESFEDSDHHSRNRYTLLSSEDDGVVIHYVCSFDHRSFGQDRVEEDSGIIKLKWKRTPEPPPPPHS